jgi:hypothetical protein
MENIKDPEVIEVEEELLKENLKGSRLKAFIWQEDPGNIPDNEEHKLLVLKRKSEKVMDDIQKNKGLTPRVYRNTLFFLYPLEAERTLFINTVKMKLACESIEDDKTLILSEEQKKDLRNRSGGSIG